MNRDLTLKQKYTVYKHTAPSNKLYIGITCCSPKSRWRNGNGYANNSYFMKAIKKYGWKNIKHEILCTGLSKQEAEAMEVELISKYKCADAQYGYNIQNGGNSIGKHSDTTKEKMRIKAIGIKNALGCKQSEELKASISKRQMGNKNALGSVRSEETRKKMSNSRRKYPVMQIDKTTNEIIAVFESMKKAEHETGINHGGITACCKGKNKLAGGYKWEFYVGESEQA